MLFARPFKFYDWFCRSAHQSVCLVAEVSKLSFVVLVALYFHFEGKGTVQNVTRGPESVKMCDTAELAGADLTSFPVPETMILFNPRAALLFPSIVHKEPMIKLSFPITL